MLRLTRHQSRLVTFCLLLFALLLLLLPARAQVPQTGRWQHLYYQQDEVHQLAEEHYLQQLQEAAELGLLNQNRRVLTELRRLSLRLILQAANWQPDILNWD